MTDYTQYAFDPIRARNGEQTVTRGGYQPTDLHFFEKVGRFVWSGNDGVLCDADVRGSFFGDEDISSSDLFMLGNGCGCAAVKNGHQIDSVISMVNTLAKSIGKLTIRIQSAEEKIDGQVWRINQLASVVVNKITEPHK